MLKRALALALIVLAASSLALPSISAQGGQKPQYDLIIVRNDDLIDYIVALPYAKLLGVPILPVNPKKLDPTTLVQLQSYAQSGWNHVLIVGDSQAVSDEVKNQLLDIGFSVQRIGGAVRTETAAKLALHFFPHGSDGVVVASSSDYGSALAAARFAMNYNYPLLLTQQDALTESTAEAIKQLHPSEVFLVGTGMSKKVQESIEKMGYQTYWFREDIVINVPEEKGTNWVTVLLAVLASLAVAVPVSLYYAKKKWAANRVPIEVLTEKERIVVKAILEKGGTVKQEELPDMTGYSRPTISRIVQELEKKQLVEREKVGKTFIVRLTKEIVMRD